MDGGWKKVGGGREGGRKQEVELTTKAEMRRRRKMWDCKVCCYPQLALCREMLDDINEI